ncbi:hypothetical protein DPMN_100334 [Dreissena polymorpha]|uniref:Uncharacterized protein n=1 Tax=Dreissena polymorpha TaxID=45954 RepID=A0A9D4LGV9_DREPO|nr:hypothetical protein DPMN_100334 [Dreissena polymorpha]
MEGIPFGYLCWWPSQCRVFSLGTSVGGHHKGGDSLWVLMLVAITMEGILSGYFSLLVAITMEGIFRLVLLLVAITMEGILPGFL